MNYKPSKEDLQDCPRCGKKFHCSKSGKCWCYEIALPLDKLEEIEELYDSCLCPDCMNEMSQITSPADVRFGRKSFIYRSKRDRRTPKTET